MRASYLSDDVPPIAGTKGAILGLSENDDGSWGYAVLLLDGREEVWCLEEADLEATGRFERRETFYDGTVVRVVVDSATDEGRLAENQP